MKHRWLIATLIATAVIGGGRATADADSCCIIADSNCSGALSQRACELSGTYYSSACNTVDFCKQAGRCEPRSGVTGQCQQLQRWACNQLGSGYNFFVGQECAKAGGTPTASPTQTKTETTTPSTPITFTPNVDIPGFGTREVSNRLFSDYVGAFFVYFVGVAGILAIVVMMWGGYHYITSAGNPQRMNQGKEIISNALIGLILTLTSFVLLRTINPALVNYGGVMPGFVKKILQPFEDSIEPDKPNGSAVEVDPGNLRVIAQRVKNAGYEKIVEREANKVGVDKYRLLALLFIESAGDPKAMSTFTRKDKSIGHACGLIQLLPETARVSCEELFRPEVNIPIAARYYADLTRNACPDAPYSKSVATRVGCSPPSETDNPCREYDAMFANAAYNAGRGSNYCSKKCGGAITVWQCDQNDGYGETRKYVQKAEKTYAWLKDASNFSF